jgi:hypothetical protein
MEAAEVETTLGFLGGNAKRVHEEPKTLVFSPFIYFWMELPSDVAYWRWLIFPSLACNNDT